LTGTYDNHSPANLSSLTSSPQHIDTPPHAQFQQAATSSGRPNVKVRKEENETLAALFADRESGQDTFGNIGTLRYILFSVMFLMGFLTSRLGMGILRLANMFNTRR
jgi:epsin